MSPKNFLRILNRFLPWIFLVALIVWGVYVTLFFIGVNGHIVVLLDKVDWESIGQTVQNPFLRGLNGFIPFVEYFFRRMQPFMSYIIASALLYVAYIIFTVLRTGRLYIKANISALHIILFGVFSLWLFTTTLFYTQANGSNPRILVEPTNEIYKGAPGEMLQVLQDNYKHLQAAGCLALDTGRKGQGGASVYWYRGWCVQKSFVTRVLFPLGMLALFILNFLVVGGVILHLLRLKSINKLLEFLVTLGTGAAGFSFMLWLLALFHSLYTFPVWVLIFLVPIAGYKFSLRWLKSSFCDKWDVRESFYSMRMLLFWLLITYIVFNFLTVIRPFPIGWDDLGRYINLPRQLSVMNQILPSIPAIQWEYITSLGFVLFGYFSTFGAVLAQQINWMAGLFAVLSVYGCTRFVLGKKTGLLAALFYYTLPMTGHYSFADMKTENALFFYGVIGFLCIFQFLRLWKDKDNSERSKSSHSDSLRWLFLAGALLAASFATKATMILMFFIGGIIMTMVLLGGFGGFGAALMSVGVLAIIGPVSFYGILQKATGYTLLWSDKVVGAIIFSIGVICIFLLYFIKKNRSEYSQTSFHWIIASAVLLAGFFAFSTPWLGRNIILNSTFRPTQIMKAPNTITPLVRYTSEEISEDAPDGSRFLPEELQIDRSHEMCAGTARAEELDRYWGHGDGWGHYLGLPWRMVMNSDSQGYYLTLSSALLLVVLLVLIPAFWKREQWLLRSLFWGTTLYLGLWIVVANGIPWYGIGMFLGFAIFTEALVFLAPNIPSQIIASLLITVGLMTSLSLRSWQFSMQYNLYEYAWGKASAEVLREMTIPDYDDITDHVLTLSKDPNHPFLYRMGTFIPYFIPRNREIIVVNDNQLEFFNCLNQEEDHVLTLKRLRALGFHSIVFDTNTATIEKNQNGTLHQKVNRFLKFANDTEIGIISVVNNPGSGIAYMILPEDLPKEDEEETDKE